MVEHKVEPATVLDIEASVELPAVEREEEQERTVVVDHGINVDRVATVGDQESEAEDLDRLLEEEEWASLHATSIGVGQFFKEGDKDTRRREE